MIFGNVDEEMFHKVLNEFPNAEELPEFGSINLFESNSNTQRTPPQAGDLPPLEGDILNSMKDSSPDSMHQSSTTVPTSGTNSGQGPQSTAMPSSASSPSYQNDSTTSATEQARKTGKSHLQDILGVTDTKWLKDMSRPIDSVPYKSPTTTTSYSSGIKATPNVPPIPSSTMAPPSRHPNITSPYNKPRQQFMFNNENPMIRPSSQGFMDNGANNATWNRGSPRNGHPNMMKSPPFPAPYVENSTISPSSVNPMSGLQSTVDSIPAAPPGSSEPGTPVMGPPLRSPLSIDATPSPGSGKMRPPPSPSLANDKRCVSADSVSAGNNGKKTGNKRERTRSADSKDDDKKETSGPKNKRRKSRGPKDENNSGKKSSESKTPGRNPGVKEEKMHSALTGLLDPQTNNPYIYIFNTDVANKAAENVNSNKVPDIILFHQSFLGNCKLRPSQNFKPKTTLPSMGAAMSKPVLAMPEPHSMSMPTTSRSPTEISMEKPDPNTQKSPKTEPLQINPETVQAINLQDTKPPMLPHPVHDVSKPPDNVPSQPVPTMTSHNGRQEELSAEKRRHRENQLGKIRKIQEHLRMQENQGEPGNGPNSNVTVHRPPGWPGQHGPMHYGPVGPRMLKGMRPEMKDIPIPAPDGMMHHPSMTPSQSMAQESEWAHLVQVHQAEKRRRHEAGIPGDLPSRPPPPYEMNGPHHRWMGPEGYTMEPRMQIDPMSHSRLQRMGSGPRPMLRMQQDPVRMPPGYIPHRIPRGHYPPPPSPVSQQRVPMYEPYVGQPGVRPTRIPHPGVRPGTSENYPFSEQLMKQASFYNSNMPQYDTEPGMAPEWTGPEGSQRLSHIPGSSPSPAMGPQGLINPMEMNPRITPGMPQNRGYDHMGPYNPEMGHQHRYEMLPPMGSPTAPMDTRLRGPSMMDAMARRGGQRPPDLNLNSQLPRSPMNTISYHGQGPMPSPSVNHMNPAVGPRYSNPNDMGHQPQPSPMQACARSPSIGLCQSLPIGPTSAGVDVPPQVMMAPHSAGPLSNPPANDWPGPNPNMSGTPTPNSGLIHHSMTSTQPGMMSSQQGMMTPQPQTPQQPGMMSPPVMMSQPGMMAPQGQGMPRMPGTPSGKHGQSTLSIMMDRMSTYKLPEKSPLYQDAVKDTASPPMAHPNEAAPLGHSAMPGMRMPVPSHPPTYDARLGHPRMGVPHMNEGFQQQPYPPGHPSHMTGASIPGGNGGMIMNMGGHESMPPPNDYQQHRPNFAEIPDFNLNLRDILPSERPSQTISYLPPENNDQFSSTGWSTDGIRPQLMPGPTHPPGPGRPIM